jgi:hypothetical protein
VARVAADAQQAVDRLAGLRRIGIDEFRTVKGLPLTHPGVI